MVKKPSFILFTSLQTNSNYLIERIPGACIQTKGLCRQKMHILDVVHHWTYLQDVAQRVARLHRHRRRVALQQLRLRRLHNSTLNDGVGMVVQDRIVTAAQSNARQLTLHHHSQPWCCLAETTSTLVYHAVHAAQPRQLQLHSAASGTLMLLTLRWARSDHFSTPATLPPGDTRRPITCAMQHVEVVHTLFLKPSDGIRVLFATTRWQAPSWAAA